MLIIIYKAKWFQGGSVMWPKLGTYPIGPNSEKIGTGIVNQ